MTASPTSIRLPADLKEWAETRSIRNHRSLNREIIAILSAIREGEKSGAGFDVFANPSGIAGDVPLFGDAA